MILIAFIAGIFLDRWLVEHTSEDLPVTEQYEVVGPSTWLTTYQRTALPYAQEAARRAAEQ